MLLLKIEQVLYLEDIARTHSITQTAQRFFMSQQSLSFSISKLEEEFSCVLVERSNRGAKLTAMGEELLREMSPYARRYETIKKKFAIHSERLDTLKDLTGSIIIEAHVRTMETLVLEVLAYFKSICPKVVCTLIEKENVDIIEDVHAGLADIGIIFVPEYIIDTSREEDEDDSLKFEKILTDKFMICAHKNHPIAKNKEIYLADVSKYDIVLFDAHARMNIESPYISNRSTQQNQIFSKDISAHKRLLLDQSAISCITAFEFKKLYKQYKELTILPIVEDLTSNITIVSTVHAQEKPFVKAFHRLLKRYGFNAIQ